MINIPTLRSAALAAGLLCIVGGLGGWAALDQSGLTRDEASSSGPIVPPNLHGWSIPAEVGDPFTDGFEFLRIAHGSVRITDVTLEGDRGLELLGVLYVPRIQHGTAQQYYPNFPPAKRPKAKNLIGATISAPQSPGYEILIGLRATEPGRLRRTSVNINYQSGGHEYVARFAAELVVCGYAPGTPPPECSA